MNENQTQTSQIPNTKKRGIKPDVEAVDIIDLILKDHEPIKALLDQLKDADMPRAQKEPIYEQFVPVLRGHALAEEGTLYVDMKEIKKLRIDGFEGDTEHAIADQLVQEIHGCADDDHWNAKVKVLAEMVEHHIKEEEEEMLPAFKESADVTRRKEIGQEYSRIKLEFDSLQTKPAGHKTRITETKLN